MRFTYFFYFVLFLLNLNHILANEKYSEVKIIHENSILEKDKGYIFGIKINLKPGWKTYWKNPGDSGSEPQILHNSNDIKNIEILYPTPKSFVDSQIETIGYENEVIFPVYVELQNGVKIINEKLKFNYLICEKICIPLEEEIFLKINTNYVSNEELSPLKITYQNLPDYQDINFSLVKAFKSAENTYEVVFLKKKNISISNFFSYIPKKNFQYSIGIEDESDKNFTVKINFDEEIIKENIYLEILFVTAENVEKKIINLNDKFESRFNKSENNNLIFLIFTAFVGGLILNLMPCVLPILSLKIYSILEITRNKKNKLHYLCISTVAGIIFSFLVLATITIILKYIGYKVGWGMQFQSETFIFVFALLLLFFGLNLAGFFEIFLPQRVMNIFDIKIKNNYINNFFTGMVATFVATPCSAPFLGTAVGYALSKGYFEIYIIFLALALGFSFPYFLPIIFKNSFKLFPKPGAWMNNVKVFLGVLVLISSLWFFSLLRIDTLYLWVGTIIICFLLCFRLKNNIKILFSILVFFLFINIFLSHNTHTLVGKDTWEKFDVARLDSLVGSKNKVFVDVTADWCVTCQFNKITTLEKKNMLKYFEKENVYLLRADWTNKDEKILNFMSNYGRYGIPLNIIYGPKNQEGIILPEILTPSKVIKNIEKVK